MVEVQESCNTVSEEQQQIQSPSYWLSGSQGGFRGGGLHWGLALRLLPGRHRSRLDKRSSALLCIFWIFPNFWIIVPVDNEILLLGQLPVFNDRERVWHVENCGVGEAGKGAKRLYMFSVLQLSGI